MKRMMLSLFTLFTTHTATLMAADSVHEFTVDGITGEEVDLSQYEGKVLLIVNTASKCGFTRQYADLVKLSEAYADKDVVVLGFPANDFRNQEPGSNEEIAAFCSGKYGVAFPMFSKVSVKGNAQHELFTYLTTAENPDFTGNIRWNFEKFLIGPDGKVARRFRSMTNPNGNKVREAIDKLLNTSE